MQFFAEADKSLHESKLKLLSTADKNYSSRLRKLYGTRASLNIL